MDVSPIIKIRISLNYICGVPYMVCASMLGKSIVERYYDYHSNYEDRRLFQDPYHMLEFIVTFHTS